MKFHEFYEEYMDLYWDTLFDEVIDTNQEFVHIRSLSRDLGYLEHISTPKNSQCSTLVRKVREVGKLRAIEVWE